MKKAIVYNKKEACIAEGWEVQEKSVIAYGKSFPIADPLSIYLNLYRTHPSHEVRYQCMYKAFCILWPEHVLTYNYWMERMFREHCNHDTEIFTLAAGGGVGKTACMAWVAIIFFLALPNKRTVIVTSTTLDSLKSRIYGYILRALGEIKSIQIPLKIKNTPPPCISPNPPDFIHGIFGIAAKDGPPEKAIKDIIGRHPKNAMLLILDEAPDMPPAIIDAIPNLKKSLEDRFQCCAIGNAASVDDLHGMLSTPKVGWDNIDPHTTYRWETTQPNGVCLYFNPYDSPAIHETDPVKKEALSVFLPTQASIIKAEQEEGKDSDSFWRMTMGYWRSRSTNKNIVSEQFLRDYDPTKIAEFSGRYPTVVCAGLDPAFSIGGDKCILRLGVLGHHVNGKMVLDFRGEHFVFILKILAKTGKSAEIQIADQVIDILGRYQVPINTLCIDASGAGRGLADVIQLRSGGAMTPTKIYSTNLGNRTTPKESLDLKISSAYEMWFTGRQFIGSQQIHGLDALACAQLSHRLILDKSGKKSLEKKDEYKKRMAVSSNLLGRSPDEADAAMLCLQAAIIHHGFFVGQEKEIVRYDNIDQYHLAEAVKKYQEMYAPKPMQTFRPKPTYSRGIASLVGRKIFNR